MIVSLYLWCFWFLKVLACNKLLSRHSRLCQLILESNDSWYLFYFVMYCRIIIARRGCKTKRACVRGDKKVFYREKDIQELMCYFFLRWLLSFKILMVGSMMRQPRCCVWDLWWNNPHKNIVLWIHDGVTRTKMLRTHDRITHS